MSNEQAEKAALKLLKNRQTRLQLTQKLYKKGFPRSVIDEVCDKMERLGYLNDTDYAEAFVHDCVLIYRYGPLKIRQALYRRGIPSAMAANAMAVYDQEVFLDNLRFMLAKEASDDTVDRYTAARFYRRMESKGYYRSQIDAVLSEVDITDEEY